MNLDAFNDYIENPVKLLSTGDDSLIKEVLKKYPFFATAHLMAVITHHSIEGVFFSENLQKEAIYFGQRIKLYESIHHPDHIHKKQLEFDTAAYSVQPLQSEEEKTIDTETKATHSKRSDTDLIIEKFLASNPSIQKPKVKFYSPVEMASRSLEESDDFATETLAKIYLRNKNYEKAIKIYQKLSLDNPEKSDYFADLIESLKDQINE